MICRVILGDGALDERTQPRTKVFRQIADAQAEQLGRYA